MGLVGAIWEKIVVKVEDLTVTGAHIIKKEDDMTKTTVRWIKMQNF